MVLMDAAEQDNTLPTIFVQTDPEDGDEKTGRTAALRVAFTSQQHANRLKEHTGGHLIVAPNELAGEQDSYVRFTIKNTSAAPAMARAMREQTGMWLHVHAGCTFCIHQATHSGCGQLAGYLAHHQRASTAGHAHR